MAVTEVEMIHFQVEMSSGAGSGAAEVQAGATTAAAGQLLPAAPQLSLEPG